MSKAGLRSLARTLSTELLPKGVRVNAVSPGPITTPIFDKLGLTEEQKAGARQQFTDSNPMKRFGQAEEVAGGALPGDRRDLHHRGRAGGRRRRHPALTLAK
jgi:NAD(P)-dependent dehydrogenase (short-subunit alcohol dehydrogenase family)